MAELAAAVLKLAEAVVDHVPAQTLALGHKGCCAHTIPMNKCVAKRKDEKRGKQVGAWKEDVAEAVPGAAAVDEGAKDGAATGPVGCGTPMPLGRWCAKLQRSPYVQNPVVAQLRQTL